ncbi:hypothetical protein PR001_g204 [Phytophthora rubi]|uniref:Tyr recombinase domain-containing protein n=1 Tax=Phytophthora rubi TaxID=129364 RepID=A0A6A3PA23_9STRA|nr:hypothetical protein PR001_g204 [Phytophthora rubi]
MLDDLSWWWHLLHSPALNGIPLECLKSLPDLDVTVITGASDTGVCVIVSASKLALTNQFSALEQELIQAFKMGVANNFDINSRELLACALAIQTREPSWQHRPAAVCQQPSQQPYSSTDVSYSNACPRRVWQGRSNKPRARREKTQRFGIHSLRAGGATNMYRAGVDSITIQFHGRWRSDAFKLYTRLCTEYVAGIARKITCGAKASTTLQ